MNQSLAQAIPGFIEDMNLRYQPRTKMMVGKEEHIVADFIDELKITTKVELNQLYLLIRKRHGELRWPSLKAVLEMERDESAAHARRKGRDLHVVSHSTDTAAASAWEDFYQRTGKLHRVKQLQSGGSVTVATLMPPSQRQSA
jgi:hypothetical protein